MELWITVPKNNDGDDLWFKFINDSISKINPKIERVVVDFNNINFLDTDEFVLLSCLMEYYHINNIKIYFINGSEKFNYHLNNIKFKQYWTKGFDRDRVTNSFNDTTLCPWHISSTMLSTYSDCARQYYQGKFRDRDLLPFSTSLSEIFNNIFDHSKSPVNGYAITQYYPNLQKLSFSICDFGLGIAKTINDFNLKEGFLLLKDSEALLKSFDRGFTVKSSPRNKGYGLANVNDFNEQHNGELTVYSNNGRVYKKAGKPFDIYETGYSFSGTLITVKVDSKSFEKLDEELFIHEF